MVGPFVFIECKMAQREKFDVNIGHQPTCALFFMKKGSFHLKMNEIDEVISDGDFVIFPEDISFVRYVIDPIVFVFIKFRLNEQYPYPLEIPYGRIAVKDRNRLIASFQTYEQLMEESGPLVQQYKQNLLENILLQTLMEQGKLSDDPDCQYSGTSCHDPMVKIAMDYIASHLNRQIPIEAVCAAAGTNRSTLNFKFRRTLNRAVGEYIMEQRMKMARRLLAGTTYSVTDIARRCGYESIYYFSRCFHKQTGETPTEYRSRFI